MALTVAIIGAGRWGRAHIRTLSSLKRDGLVERLLVCDTDLEKLIDLGPEAGNAGGYLVGQGTPEEISKIKKSYTGFYLSNKLK